MRSLAVVVAAFLLSGGEPSGQNAPAKRAAKEIIITTSVLKLKSAAYEAISLVSEGPAYDFSGDDHRGKFQRIVVLSPDVVYDHPLVRFETLGYGDEGCCRHLIGAFQLDLGELENHGVALPDATRATVQSVRWLGPQRVDLYYGSVICRFNGLGVQRLHATCRRAE